MRRVRIKCHGKSKLVGSYLDLFCFYFAFDVDRNAAYTSDVQEAIYNLSRRLKDNFELRPPNLKKLYHEYLRANDLVDCIASRCDFLNDGQKFSRDEMRLNYHCIETSEGHYTRDRAGEIDDEWSEETDFYYDDGKIYYIDHCKMDDWKYIFMHDMKCVSCTVHADCKKKCRKDNENIDDYVRLAICNESDNCEVEKNCRRCMAEFFGDGETA